MEGRGEVVEGEELVELPQLRQRVHGLVLVASPRRRRRRRGGGGGGARRSSWS